MMGSGQARLQGWQTKDFRSSIVRRLEKIIKDCDSQTKIDAVRFERMVFKKAKSKEEYLNYAFKNYVLHLSIPRN